MTKPEGRKYGSRQVITFVGIIHPQAGMWRLAEPWLVRHEGDEVRLLVQRSMLNMQVVLGEEPPADSDLQSLVMDLLRKHMPVISGALDSLGFHCGARLTPEVLTGNVGSHAVFTIQPYNPYLSNAMDDSGAIHGSVLGPFIGTAVALPPVRFALADVTRASAFDEDCGFYCYRALESLRQHYVDDDAERSSSWEALRTDLGLAREGALAAIQEDATSRRHGEKSSTDVDTRFQWVEWTREVITNFVGKHSVSGVGEPLVPPLAPSAERAAETLDDGGQSQG